MNISKNIKWIINATENWILYINKSYKVKIQKADPERIYNVPGKKGIVYNILEDSYEKVGTSEYIITGISGEMWPIESEKVKKYKIKTEDIAFDPVNTETIELDTVYAAIRIPANIEFTLEVDYGKKAVLKGNRPEINHLSGDYILISTKKTPKGYIPNFEDKGRIINGCIFNKLYERL